MREERRARFMELAEELSARRMKKKVGKTLRVLVDEVSVKIIGADGHDLWGEV